MYAKYKRGAVTGRFEGKHDFVSWYAVSGTPQGTILVCKRTRCAYGSKVVVDTWCQTPVNVTPNRPNGQGE